MNWKNHKNKYNWANLKWFFQNNNPKVFTKDARPIIEFSIENRKALNAREKRQQKSVEKNPTLNGNKKAVNDSKTLAMKNVKLNTGKVRSGCPHIGALNFQIVRFWGHPINSHVWPTASRNRLLSVKHIYRKRLQLQTFSSHL